MQASEKRQENQTASMSEVASALFTLVRKIWRRNSVLTTIVYCDLGRNGICRNTLRNGRCSTIGVAKTNPSQKRTQDYSFLREMTVHGRLSGRYA